MNLIVQLFRRKQLQDDLSEEIHLHLAERTEELVDAGMLRDEAAAAARREFGDVTQAEEYAREMWCWPRLEELLFDIRYSLRLLRKNPGFTAVVLLTLAIGIGANTAIFSVVNAVLLRPLPFPEPDRLVFLTENCRDIPEMFISMPNLRDWQSMNTAFEGIAGARRHGATMTGRGEPQRLETREVTAGLFPTMGVQPIMGRTFTADDDRVTSQPTVVLNETFWNREFERDPRVLGMQLELDGKPYTVIGVVPARGFRLIWNGHDVDAYTSLGRLEKQLGGRADHYGIYGYARLKPGVTVEAARSEMRQIAAHLSERYPKTNLGQSAAVHPLLAERVEDIHRPLLLLMGAVGLVLLIACANVANLLTSLATVRRREIAVRSALGAGAARLARQFLCESILLSLLGGALGLITAYCVTAGASETLTGLPAALIPRVEEISVDHSVLFFTLVVSLLTGLVFGIFPALSAYRTDPNEVLKENTRTTGAGLSDMRLRNTLVATELALSLVLLVAAGLMIKSLFRLMQSDPGFRSDGVMTATLSLPPARYATDAQRRGFVRQLTEKISGLPRVQASGLKFPLLGPYEDNFVVEGKPRPAPGTEPYTEMSLVTPGALEAMGVKLVYGRYLNNSDDENAKPVCIVDDSLAKRYWPGSAAIGQRISTIETPSTPPQWTTIVGVVHHVENNASGGPTLPGTYFPFAQRLSNGGSVVIHSGEDPNALIMAVRTVLHSLDPDLALYDVSPLSHVTHDRVAPRKLSVILLSILAGIAVLVAALGTYGVMAYMVTGRTQEMGVRRALGATPTDVMKLVMHEGICVALGGLLAGIITSLLLGHIVRPMLFGVKASDPVTFASVGVLLLAVALAASYVPARRAMRLNPLEAVRHE